MIIDFVDNGENKYKSALTNAEIEKIGEQYILRTPEFAGHSEKENKFDSIEGLNVELADFLIKWTTVDIGAGFHPDTSVDQYEPKLRPELRKQYTEILDFCFEYLNDPYEAGLQAGFDAGIYGENMKM